MRGGYLGNHEPPSERNKGLVPFASQPGASNSYDQGRPSAEVMSDFQIKQTVRLELDTSLGWSTTRLARARRLSLSEYYGSPRGDERSGHSQVVSRTVFEQVEWALPPMMEIFTAGLEVARFSPNEEEDEEQAKEATDLTNYIFRQQSGFMVLYTMFKDAFIQKLGVVRVGWDKSRSRARETYTGKTFMEASQLMQDEDFEIESFSARMGEQELTPEQEQDIQALQMSTFDIEGFRSDTFGHVTLDNVAPEDFGINREARSLSHPTCRFIYQRHYTTQSEAISWGFDPEKVRRIPTTTGGYLTDTDVIVRASQDDADPLRRQARRDSERGITIFECFTKIDINGDGISEWCKVFMGGDYGEVMLDYEEIDGHPFAAVTPIPIPHRVYGLSLADVSRDLGNIETTLWRQLLNSLYENTDPRWAVLSQGSGQAATPMANLDQLTNTVYGGYVEEYQPNAIRPLVQSSNAAEMPPALEFHDQMKVKRTGISPDAMGVDPEAISKHVYGAMVQQSGAMQRLTLYARVFAETGVREMFKLIYKELQQNQTKPMAVKLRGQWLSANPSEWKNGYDCTISVGLGHGSKMERGTNLQSIGQMQVAMREGGQEQIATDQNIYNTAAAFTEEVGFKDTSRFFTDPSTQPAQPEEPETDLAQELMKLESQTSMMKVEIERQKMEIERDKVLLELKKVELHHEVEVEKLRLQGSKLSLDEAGLDLTSQAKMRQEQDRHQEAMAKHAAAQRSGNGSG